jgi:hypothetical protein
LRLAGGDLLQKAWFPEAAAPVAMVHGQPDGSCKNNAPTTNTIRQHRVWGPRCGSTAWLPVVTNPLPHAPGRAAQRRRLGRQSVATTCFCTGLFRLQRWVASLLIEGPWGLRFAHGSGDTSVRSSAIRLRPLPLTSSEDKRL